MDRTRQDNNVVSKLTNSQRDILGSAQTRAKIRAAERALREQRMEIVKLGQWQSAYSEIMADNICTMLADGMTLRQIAAIEGYPPATTIRYWATHPDEEMRPGFVARYLEAREMGFHMMAEDIINIADDSGSDMVPRQNKDGSVTKVVDLEHIMRDKMRIAAREFMVKKNLPEIYGDTKQAPVNVTVTLSDRMAAARQRIIDLPTTKTIEAKAEEV